MDAATTSTPGDNVTQVTQHPSQPLKQFALRWSNSSDAAIRNDSTAVYRFMSTMSTTSQLQSVRPSDREKGKKTCVHE